MQLRDSIQTFIDIKTHSMQLKYISNVACNVLIENAYNHKCIEISRSFRLWNCCHPLAVCSETDSSYLIFPLKTLTPKFFKMIS